MSSYCSNSGRFRWLHARETWRGWSHTRVRMEKAMWFEYKKHLPQCNGYWIKMLCCLCKLDRLWYEKQSGLVLVFDKVSYYLKKQFQNGQTSLRFLWPIRSVHPVPDSSWLLWGTWCTRAHHPFDWLIWSSWWFCCWQLSHSCNKRTKLVVHKCGVWFDRTHTQTINHTRHIKKYFHSCEFSTLRKCGFGSVGKIMHACDS